MTPAAFNASLAKAAPPAGLSPALTALWWAGKNEWGKAHALAMSEDGPECAWVQPTCTASKANLDDARYWYRQARRPPAAGELADEWAAIAAALLEA